MTTDYKATLKAVERALYGEYVEANTLLKEYEEISSTENVGIVLKDVPLSTSQKTALKSKKTAIETAIKDKATAIGVPLVVKPKDLPKVL